MTKVFLGIAFLFFQNSLFSQVTGTQFAPVGTRWSVEDFFYGAPPSTVHRWGNFRISGDTVINNKLLQKIDTSVTAANHYDTLCMAFSGKYFYYDNKKLYLDTVLLYDFNLNAGDTFNLYYDSFSCGHPVGYYKMPVDSVDSLFYGNKWRKRITFKQMVGFYFGPVIWVEGIGDIKYGFFNVAFPTGYTQAYYTIEWAFCFNGYARLNCFQEVGYAAYGNYCYNGPCPTGLNESANEYAISIYPNPVSNFLNIESKQPNENAELIIADVLGREIKSLPIQNQTTTVNMNDLKDGIYFVQIKTANGIVAKKIIVKK
jgi:hypothetical protein